MDHPAQEKSVVKTSLDGWLTQIAAFYRQRKEFILEDDAHIGIDPREDTLIRMGLKAKLSKREWVGVLVALGIAVFGAWVIVMAVLDPEPYSKIAAVVGSGATLVLAGGLTAVRILTKVKPPNIRVSAPGVFDVFWS